MRTVASATVIRPPPPAAARRRANTATAQPRSTTSQPSLHGEQPRLDVPRGQARRGVGHRRERQRPGDVARAARAGTRAAAASRRAGTRASGRGTTSSARPAARTRSPAKACCAARLQREREQRRRQPPARAPPRSAAGRRRATRAPIPRRSAHASRDERLAELGGQPQPDHRGGPQHLDHDRARARCPSRCSRSCAAWSRSRPPRRRPRTRAARGRRSPRSSRRSPRRRRPQRREDDQDERVEADPHRQLARLVQRAPGGDVRLRDAPRSSAGRRRSRR